MKTCLAVCKHTHTHTSAASLHTSVLCAFSLNSCISLRSTVALGCHQPLMCVDGAVSDSSVCVCGVCLCFVCLFVFDSCACNTLHYKQQRLFKKSPLDAASSPALSLVTNGHHFRVPNRINVSSGTLM